MTTFGRPFAIGFCVLINRPFPPHDLSQNQAPAPPAPATCCAARNRKNGRGVPAKGPAGRGRCRGFDLDLQRVPAANTRVVSSLPVWFHHTRGEAWNGSSLDPAFIGRRSSHPPRHAATRVGLAE